MAPDTSPRAFPSPLVGEGFPPRSCASAALRKSHGGKGEGALFLRRGLRPLTPHHAPRGACALPQPACAKPKHPLYRNAAEGRLRFGEGRGESEASAACMASLRRADSFYNLPLVGRSARSARRVGGVALEAASASNPSPLVGRPFLGRRFAPYPSPRAKGACALPQGESEKSAAGLVRHSGACLREAEAPAPAQLHRATASLRRRQESRNPEAAWAALATLDTGLRRYDE